MRRIFLCLLIAAAAVAPSSAAEARTTSAPARAPRFVAHRVLVQADDAVLREHGLRPGRRVGATGFTVVDTGDEPAETVRDRLRADPRVAAVELDYVRRAFATPNDPLYNQYQAPLRRVRFPQAWDQSKAGPLQTIAVIDSGVDLDHPDLVAQLDTVNDFDFVDDDFMPEDENGHGTTVAGVASAVTDNGTGGAGAAWNARILALKVLDAEGEGTDSDIVAAIEWAVDNGADVINLSFGGPDDSQILKTAVESAEAANVVVVAAAGNEGIAEASYPAAYDGVLAVGATDGNGHLAYFSQHGPWVDIAAPGTAILGPAPSEQYALGTGTSFSAPIVAGAAAMVRTKELTFTASQVVDRLQATAQDNGPTGKDDSYGHGVLDVYAAVGGAPLAAIPPAAGDSAEPNPARASARLITGDLSGMTIAPEGDVDWYALDLQGSSGLTVTVTPAGRGSGWQAMGPLLEIYDPNGSKVAEAQDGDPDDGRVDEVAGVSLQTAVTGRFTVRVASATGSRSAPGGYALDLTITAPPPAPPPPPPPPPPPAPAPPARSGYWMVDSGGHVYAFGDARYLGGLNGARENVVDLEPTPSGNGYWLLTAVGEIYSFGDARHHGQPGRLPVAGETVTSMSAHPGGAGYWVFTSRGRALAFGGAPYKGDMAAVSLNGPVLDSVATPSGDGYYMVASDGGIFTFGDAAFRGSMGGHRLNAPVQSLVPDADNHGYWLVASDGGIFSFDAVFRGSMGATRLNRPVTGMVRFGNGYLMVGEDGGIFTFSDKPFHGSLGNNPPPRPVVAVAAL